MYKNNSERDIATIKGINQGLKEKYLCIYASVNAYDISTLSRISSKIIDYKENINKRNFLIINLKPFYDSALMGDLAHFEKLKIQIQNELEHRNNKSVIIFADCADNLFQNQYFDQSELVESWWHRVYMEWIQQEKERHNQRQNHVTIICPHLDSLMDKHPFDQHKCKIFDNHSVAIDIAGNIIFASQSPVKRADQEQLREPIISPVDSQIYILVAEPDSDLQQIYSMWLHSKGFKNILITDSGRKIIEEFIKIENKPNFKIVVILDSHIKDISYVDPAKEITNRKPNSQIILTTTLPSDSINLVGININNFKILSKPLGYQSYYH